MAKVLFFNSPMYGHVLPTLAVVEELIARGEQITYYLTDEFAQSIHKIGAIFRSYKSTMNNNRPAGRFSRFLAEECQYVIPQVIASIRDEKPDYIIYEENCLWGRILAHSFDVPVISCRASLAVNNHFSHIPHFLDTQKSSIASLKFIVETLNDLMPLTELCATYQLPAPPQDIDSIFFHAEELNIIFISRLLQPAGDTFDKRFVFVGPPAASQKEMSIMPELVPSSASPVVYISLGTIYNVQPDFYKICFQAFEEQPWHVIMSIGRNINQAQLGPVPENVIVQSSVPQLAVLQHATIFITHGGLNSMMESLYYGVPMVIIPQMPEQMITGRRVMELGVGVVLDSNTLTACALQDAVAKLSQDASVSARMKHVQKEVQESGGAKHAADAIQQFVDVH